MSIKQKLRHELVALASVVLFFGCWIAVLVLLKQLLLAEYDIAFHGFLKAMVGVLVLAKVVLVVDHVSLGAWVRSRPAWVGVVLRTALSGLGIVVVLLLEKGIDGRQEHGGMGPALAAVFQNVEIHHVWANTICLTGALLTYYALSVVRHHLGEGGWRRVFFSPPVPDRDVTTPESSPGELRQHRASSESHEKSNDRTVRGISKPG